MSDFTMTDLFCGGGGSSAGAIQVPGVTVRLALNHSQVAIRTHNHNHPTTDHDCADISQVNPRRYPRTDLLWGSAECTNQTKTKGRKRNYGEHSNGLFATDGTDEAAIRSRATMWDIPRFAEAHRYRVIIAENVTDTRWWGPPESPGLAFDSWLAAVRAWGYEHQVIYLDSIHATRLGPGSRSRRARMYVVFWRSGERRPDFNKWLRPYGDCPIHGRVQLVQAWKTTKTCSPDRPWGVYGIKNGQYLYRCPRTDRHDSKTSIIEPVVRTAAEAIEWGRPAPTIGERKVPLVPNTMRKIRDGWAKYQQALLIPCGGSWNDKAYTVDQPARTRTATESEGVLIPPYIVELHGGGSSHRPVDYPLSTITAGGINHGLVYADQCELLPYYGNSQTVPVTAPAPTITTVDTLGLLGYATSVEDCRYRMLTVRENANAMEFPETYEFLGERHENIAMIGNAVNPNVGRDLVGMVTEAVTGDDLEVAA